MQQNDTFRMRAIQTMEIKVRDDLHLSRKLYHVMGILMIVGIMAQLQPRESLFYLSLGALIILPFDILRLRRSDLNHKIIGLFKPVIRIDEVKSLSGTSFLVIGCILVTLLFPKNITILALLLLAFGDPASSTFGVLFGKDKIWGRKSLQGSIACFVVCTIICGVYFVANNVMVDRLILVSILGGLIGSLSELIQIKKLDDNLTFPVFAALGLWGLYVVFGGFS